MTEIKYTGKKWDHYEVNHKFTLGLAAILLYWLVILGMVVNAYFYFNPMNSCDGKTASTICRSSL